MKPEDLEKIPLQVEKMFNEMQNRVLDDIVRRIKKTGGITSTADYQIEKLKIFGNSSEYIESEIKRLLKASDAEIWGIYDQVIDKQYTRDKSLYEQINAQFIPYEENEIMQDWVKAVTAQTKGEFKNITQSMGFSVITGNKRVFTPLSEYYQKYLDRACMDIVTGVFDYNTVLRRVVKEMTDSGIRTVNYASGHSNRITVASRRAVMTGIRQLTGQINEMTAEKLGTDSYEVEWHSGARPSHWWGGRVFTMEELKSVCGLGTGPGLCGWNCYHSYHAFIPGVSVRTYTDAQLAEMNAKEKEVTAWKGKEYNAYDATQKQRQMETAMRAQREKIDLLKKGGADKDDIIIAKARYQSQLNEYRDFSKKMGLQEQRERIYYDLRGKIATNSKKQNAKWEGKKAGNKSRNTSGKNNNNNAKQSGPIANGADSDIIKSNNVVYEGIPRTWKKLENTDDVLQSVNPLYKTRDEKYTTNCVNCVPAYEMRKRGYDVVAKPATGNHYLNRKPEAAWKEPDVRTSKGSGLEDIKKAFADWPDGARAEVAILWQGGDDGHVFVAEKFGEVVKFLDVQSGTKIDEELFTCVEKEKTRFWRVDTLEPSDRGVTACKGGE